MLLNYTFLLMDRVGVLKFFSQFLLDYHKGFFVSR